MMKGASVLVLLGLFLATTSASFYYDAKTADKDYLLKQKQVYNLFYHIPQPELVNPDQYKLGQAWNIEEKIDLYTDKDAVKEFLKFYQYGMLPRGEMFSVYYPKLMKESLALFHLFYYAKDFDTFFNTALWARIHMNEGTYSCALYQAVLRRPDTKYIQLPYPYEIYPYAFFNSEVLEKAKNAHLYREISKTGSCTNCDGNSIIINGNYSGWYIEREYDTEMKLKYFIEDIGFSTYYFYLRQDSPFWLKSDKYNLMKDIRGEEYLYGHKQLMARYYLERMANGLEEIEDFDWNNEFYPGYYPTMTYHNGLPFPQRPHWSKIPHYKYFYAREIQDYESRISAAIDLGYVLDAEGKRINIYTEEGGLNILGNIIEGNEDSCNKAFYGSIDTLGRKILGFNLEPKTPYQIIPSALESFASSMRDPAFYRLYKRICQYYFRYKAHLKPYTKDEIIYPGIKIESVAVDKLTTYFDDFDATISNGLLIANEKEADTFSVKVRQERLNHKPFTVHFGIHADKTTKVAIRMFLGPKYDGRWNHLDFTESYKYFYELDSWVTDLTAGANKIERNSKDFYFVYPDDVTSDATYKKVDTCLGSGENFNYEERIYGFPQRLLLPKGRRAGSQYQLFVYISPVEGEPIQYTSRVWGSYQFSKRSFGFPLDRPVEYSNFMGPNSYFKDVTIYHKYDYDANTTA